MSQLYAPDDMKKNMKPEETTEGLLRLVMDNIPQAVFWKDRNSVYLGCNAVFARFAGIKKPEDIVGKTDNDLAWTKEEADAFRLDDRRVMDSDTPLYHIIEPQLQADGKHAWLDTNKIPMHDTDGNVIGILGTYEDITERKNIEEALRESEESLALAQKNAHVGTWIINLSDYSLKWTEEIYKIFGEDMSTFTPSYDKFIKAILPEDRERVVNAIKATAERGIHYNEEYRILRPDGMVRYIRSEGDANFKDGMPVKMMGVCFDITERKKYEVALQKAKSETDLYVDLMGHDINNMNQITMGFIELAHNLVEQEGKLDAAHIDLLDKAIESLMNSSTLIDNVRKLKLEKLGLYEPEELDVVTILNEVIWQYREIPGRQVNIICSCKESCTVKANALLRDVFGNLIGNAIKHSTGSLTINISVNKVFEKGNAYCRIDVEDTGPGIPDKMKDTLFCRLNLANTKARGKGFGLCLIKMLIDDYHGMFWAEDRVPGDYSKGAKFVVMLPAIDA